jgi:hypothetical protein
VGQRATRVLELSSSSNENTPELSADGLTMWLATDRPGGEGTDDLWYATRTDRDATWTTPVPEPVLNSPKIDRGPSLFLGDLDMMIHSARTGTQLLYLSTRTDITVPWTTPVEVTAPQAGAFRAWISPCGFEMYYQDAPVGSDMNFYYARRASLADDFIDVRRLDELDSTAYDQDLRLSPDRHHAYFASARAGKSQIYEAVR